MNKKIAKTLIGVVLAGILIFPVSRTTAQVTPDFSTGDIVIAKNNTTNGEPGDSITAEPGNVIEYRMTIQNIAHSIAQDVLVGILWPQTPSKTLVITMEASANGVRVSDTATVNVINTETNHLLDYYHGHSRVFSPSCPEGCNVDDSSFLRGEPINIGDLYFGESAQVFFKASVNRPVTEPTPTVTPTPTAVPTPIPTIVPTITPTPTGIPTPTPTEVPQGQNQEPILACPAGFLQTISGSTIVCVQQVQQQSQTSNSNATVGNVSGGSSSSSTGPINVTLPQVVMALPTPQPAPQVQPTPAVLGKIQTLPKTGLPLLAWAFSGLLPIGTLITKRGLKNKMKSEETPLYLFREREFLKE